MTLNIDVEKTMQTKTMDRIEKLAAELATQRDVLNDIALDEPHARDAIQRWQHAEEKLSALRQQQLHEHGKAFIVGEIPITSEIDREIEKYEFQSKGIREFAAAAVESLKILADRRSEAQAKLVALQDQMNQALVAQLQEEFGAAEARYLRLGDEIIEALAELGALGGLLQSCGAGGFAPTAGYLWDNTKLLDKARPRGWGLCQRLEVRFFTKQTAAAQEEISARLASAGAKWTASQMEPPKPIAAEDPRPSIRSANSIADPSAPRIVRATL